MNKVILCGRLTRDAEVRWGRTGNGDNFATARFSLAVDRKAKKDGEQSADFINCVSFGKTAEFLEKYGNKGTKFIAEGRIQTGSYTNKDGQKVYTTDVVVEQVEFAESKASEMKPAQSYVPTPPPSNGDGFMAIPDAIQEELPFN